MIRKLARILAFALTAACSTAVSAHAVLLDTTPADGAALNTAPELLRLHFNEPVRPIFLRLIDSNGHQHLPADAVQSRNTTLTAALPSLPKGAYIVSWRAVSIDGHPIGGAFTFRIGAGQAAASPAMATTTGTGWLTASGIIRFLVYSLTLLAAGGALFITAVLPALNQRETPAALRRYVLLCCAGVAAALIISVGIEGGLLTLGAWTAIFDPGVWRLAISGSTGPSVAVSLIGVALVVAGLFHKTRANPGLLLCGAILAIAGFGLSGHAATASPRWLTTPAVVIHGLAAAFWIGALWPLAWTLRHRQTAEAASVIRRFSRLAVVTTALLVLAGIALAVVQLGSVAALWQTTYGLVLVAKVATVLALLGLAALNKLRLTPALVRNDSKSDIKLGRSISVEIILAIIVLAATAVIGTVPPPRSLALQSGHAEHRHTDVYTVQVTEPPYTARIEVTPTHPGVNTVTVHLTRDGETIEPLQASFAFSLPAAGIAPITRMPKAIESGVLRYTGPELTLPGQWTLHVKALITDFERVTFETTIPIR